MNRRFREIVYTGTSMKPTFKDLDLLRMAEVSSNNIRIGDILVFKPSEIETNVIHRVVRKSAEGFIMQADNNSKTDVTPIAFGEVIGRIYHRKSIGLWLPVLNGIPGNCYFRTLRFGKAMTGFLRNTILYSIIDLLDKLRLFKFVSKCLRIRVLSFENSTHPRKAYIGRFFVGEYSAETESWFIRPVFRIFIDEKSLPAD